MTGLWKRILAGSGAFFFLLTASATTIFVLATSGNGSKTPDDQSSQQAKTCSDSQTEAALTAPDVYKPEGGAVSTLQQTDLQTGSGAAAKAGDCVVVKYYGTLASDGTKFDEDFTDTTGFAFTLGQGQVITGWDQGLVGMKVGGTRRLVIPASMGYGDQAQGSIPANSDLVFVVKLLRIQKV